MRRVINGVWPFEVPKLNVSVSMPGEVMLFHIIMHNGKTVTMSKPDIIQKVKDSYFRGLCKLELANDSVIASEHIELMRKLYAMATEEKVYSWLSKLKEFKQAGVRSHILHTELMTEYEEIVQVPDDATDELKKLHRVCVIEYRTLKDLKF